MVITRTPFRISFLGGDGKRIVITVTQQLLDSFWSKVIIGTSDECWFWQARVGKDGYGSVKLCGHTRRAHRIAWLLANPRKLLKNTAEIMHSCDVTLCVNPHHLSRGTRRQNSDDMVRKGRSARGERNCKAKLTPRQVKRLRRLYATGRYHQYDLANTFCISRGMVGHIVRRMCWRHV